MGAFGTYTPPAQIGINLIPFTAGVNIDRGRAVVIKATGLLGLSDNTAPAPLPCIGIAANAALAGQQCFVQVFGEILIPNTGPVITKGDFVGDADGSGKVVNISTGIPSLKVSAAGVCLFSDANSILVLILPCQISGSGGGAGVTSFNGRAGVVLPANGDYSIGQITGAVTSVFTRNGAVVATATDYSAVPNIVIGDGVACSLEIDTATPSMEMLVGGKGRIGINTFGFPLNILDAVNGNSILSSPAGFVVTGFTATFTFAPTGDIHIQDAAGGSFDISAGNITFASAAPSNTLEIFSNEGVVINLQAGSHFSVYNNNTTASGLQVFANNAAAIAGGLIAGDFYRTGGDPDLVATVH